MSHVSDIKIISLDHVWFRKTQVLQNSKKWRMILKLKKLLKRPLKQLRLGKYNMLLSKSSITRNRKD